MEIGKLTFDCFLLPAEVISLDGPTTTSATCFRQYRRKQPLISLVWMVDLWRCLTDCCSSASEKPHQPHGSMGVAAKSPWLGRQTQLVQRAARQLNLPRPCDVKDTAASTLHLLIRRLYIWHLTSRWQSQAAEGRHCRLHLSHRDRSWANAARGQCFWRLLACSWPSLCPQQRLTPGLIRVSDCSAITSWWLASIEQTRARPEPIPYPTCPTIWLCPAAPLALAFRDANINKGPQWRYAFTSTQVGAACGNRSSPTFTKVTEQSSLADFMRVLQCNTACMLCRGMAAVMAARLSARGGRECRCWSLSAVI